MTCDVPTLMAAGKCWCAVTVDPVKMVELQLLAQTYQALSPGADVSLPTLMQQGKCFCAVTNSSFEKVRLALLCDIASAQT